MAIEKVLAKIASHQNPKHSIHAETKEFKHLEMIFRNCVLNAESSSLIVLGPTGCGKTTLINSVVESLDKCQNFSSRKIITLCGLLCGDLKAAMISISHSLKLEDEFEGLIGDGNNFEDRLADVLNFLRASLASTTHSSPLIIILDHIDLLCDHRGQALLYNLFDIVQSKQSPLCVVGVTSRVDILELLEKRVKSRFSHRILQLGSSSFKDYCQFTQKLLTLSGDTNTLNQWNTQITELLENKQVEQVLRNLYDTDNTVGTLVKVLYTVLVNCCDDGEITPERVSENFSRIWTSSKVNQAMNLSVTEMFIMMAIYRVTKNNHPTFNFLGLYEIIGKSAADSNLKKEDLYEALSSLAESQLVIPVDKKSEINERYYKSEITLQEFMHIFKLYPKLPSVLQRLL